MKIDLNQFLASFFDEATEHLETMETALLDLESTPTNTELLDTVFRAAHTIKGASSTFGVNAVAEFTHVLENLLDRMRAGEFAATAEICEVLLTSVDTLRGLISSARDGTAGPEDVGSLIAKLQSFTPDAESKSGIDSVESLPEEFPQTDRAYNIAFKPSREFFHFGLDPVFLLRDLAELGQVDQVTLDDSQIPDIDSIDPEACYLAWTLRLTTSEPKSQIEDVFMFVDDQTVVEIQAMVEPEPGQDLPSGPLNSDRDPTIEDSSPGSAPIDPSKPRPAVVPPRENVRVDGERLDDMINQIGELVIGVSMVEEEWADRHPGVESTAIIQLSKIVRDLQERSLSLRMVPIGATFKKMARVVRDLSRKLGKQIEFETSGEETELDKTVVDKIGDPLLHMIRNAVDHGIEPEDERIEAGKPAKGTVTLKAFHKGGNIYVEITDDGRGLNLDRIKEKAIERGVIGAEENPSDQELANLIFAPGFSTAEVITDVSGRGVGMDVVRQNVESLQGSVSIRTQWGYGSTVTVRLPLTLAILDGLTVSLGDEVLVLPLLSVVESIRPSNKDVKTVVNKGEVLVLRGEVVPLLRLNNLLKIKSTITDASEGLLVIVEEQHRKFALLVDELLGQQQVVIKNMETNFRKVPGVAGATILGNGSVAFILDINGICSLSKQSSQSNESPSNQKEQAPC